MVIVMPPAPWPTFVGAADRFVLKLMQDSDYLLGVRHVAGPWLFLPRKEKH
jgi:hypothetical protein